MPRAKIQGTEHRVTTSLIYFSELLGIEAVSNMPRTQQLTTTPAAGAKHTCDLCRDFLEKEQDVLKCDGECGCTVYQYCAGITKHPTTRMEVILSHVNGDL